MKNSFLLIVLFFTLFSCSNSSHENTMADDTSAVEEENTLDLLDTTGGKGVFFENLKDSEVVKSPLLVKMGVIGMEVEAAGAINPLKGHHHIIIDGTAIEYQNPVPLDDAHLHFGKGQLEAELKLTPGFHTLTLQFANGVHSSYGPRWAKTITVEVK
jgi:hypothetical protein